MGRRIHRRISRDADVGQPEPAGIPEQTARAARDTLGGAVAVASELPAQTGGAVLDVGREAFAWSFELAADVGAALSIATAVVALTFLRHVAHEAEPV